jgi:hypothetical protein
MQAGADAGAASGTLAEVAGRRCLVPAPSYPVHAGPIPSFSVVVPTYEAAAFAGEAIRSALEQTVPPHEVIVCDDGSSDDIEAALPRSDRIILLRQPHRGVAAARNMAVREASGEFVAMLDADDAYLPERLEALGALAVARPDLDIVTTDALYERQGSVCGRFGGDTPFEVEDQRAAILGRCFCPWPAIRRSRLLAIGGFDEGLITGSDWECAIRLVLAGCAAGLVDEPLYRYRLRDGSLTSRRVTRLQQRIHFLEKTLAHPGLRPAEMRALRRSIAAQRRSLLVAEAAEASDRRDARRRGLRIALARGMPAATRLRAAVTAVAPGAGAGLSNGHPPRPGLEAQERSDGSGATR